MIDDSLNYIEQWLAANAPRILNESLNLEATEDQIAALETAIGQPLPNNYKALYRWHDGMNEDENIGNFFYAMSFMPLTKVMWWVDCRKQYKAEPIPLEKAATALNSQNLENPLWLKLGFDGSHTWLMVDLDPSKLGTYGQVIFVDEEYETAFLIANSIAELLATFVQDLSVGLYQLDTDAASDGEDFLEADARIDLINWHNAERWQHAVEQ